MVLKGSVPGKDGKGSQPHARSPAAPVWQEPEVHPQGWTAVPNVGLLSTTLQALSIVPDLQNCSLGTTTASLGQHFFHSH